MKSAIGCIAALCASSIFGAWPLEASGQGAEFGFIGQVVIKRSAATGEVLGSGELLKDPLFDPNLEVKKLTLRYAPDTVATRRSGAVYTVSRLMDFYFPTPTINLEDTAGNAVNNLPLMVVLHSGSGSRETSAEYARYWASLGFTVIAPTVRSDRFGFDYCECYRKSFYTAIQDIRAAIRLYSKTYDLSLLNDSMLASTGTTPGQLNVIRKFRKSRTDGNAIFLIGKSYGGTIAYQAATRVQQEAFEDYLWANGPYIINGIQGPMNMGQGGAIDAVGVKTIRNYPFPASRIRGFISRTAAVFDSVETIDYGGSANPVPGLFIHNTCDKVVPYSQRDFVHNTGLCDADIVRPDGLADSTARMVGSSLITEHMHNAGVYSELLTFCGGGHDSNRCAEELIDSSSAAFVRRILSNAFIPGDRYERVYRYNEGNYSDQCCAIGDEYGFMLKCSCDTANPYSVVDLPYMDPSVCPMAPSCELTSLCDLQAPGLFGMDVETTPVVLTIQLLNDGQAPYFNVGSYEAGTYGLRIMTMSGRMLYAAMLHLDVGTNHIALPAGLPTRELLIGALGNAAPVKFHLAD